MRTKESNKTGLTLLEQETIILYNRAENQAEVFTYDPKTKTRLKKLAAANEEVKLADDNGHGGLTFTMPKELISFRSPTKRKPISEEEKAERTKRLLKGRSTKKHTEN